MWVFRRNRECLIHQLRRHGRAYKLVIRYQDGWVDIEHFPDLVTSIEYAIGLRRTLIGGGWQPSFVLDGPLAAAS